MAEAPAMGPTHLAGGSGTRGDRAARRRGRAAAGSTVDPRGRPHDPRDFPPAERVPSRRHVLSAGTAVQAHRGNQEIRGRGDEIARPRRAGEGHRRRQVARTPDAREVRREVRPGTREEPDDDGRGFQETGGALMAKEYRTITEIAGPLIFVEKTEPVGYNELVEVQLTDGRRMRGQVLDSSTDVVVVQIFEGTAGIDRALSVKFLGETIKLSVSREMLGRILTGSGEPADGGPPILPEKRVEIQGAAINPYSREHPAEIIQPGISQFA